MPIRLLRSSAAQDRQTSKSEAEVRELRGVPRCRLVHVALACLTMRKWRVMSQSLFDIVRNRAFEPFRDGQRVDQRGHYRLALDPRFPLAVKLYSFSPTSNFSVGRFNWHERLEINATVAGCGRLRMGDRIVNFSPGDIIVVDNLKLHGVLDDQGQVRKIVVITFMSDLICHPGSYPCDSIYLRPFFSRAPDLAPVLRPRDRLWAPVATALGNLVECYTAREPGCEAGCKAYLLDALYGITRHFGLAEPQVDEFARQKRESLHFGHLHDYLWENYSEPITVSRAASIVGMSKFRFMRFFKKATGMTFVTYLTDLRLSNAYRMLVETDRTIAEVAAEVGFSDQSYFDRRFHQHYHQTPRQVRETAGLSK